MIDKVILDNVKEAGVGRGRKSELGR